MKKLLVLAMMLSMQSLFGMGCKEELLPSNCMNSPQAFVNFLKSKKGWMERLACHKYNIPLDWFKQTKLYYCFQCNEGFQVNDKVIGFIEQQNIYIYHQRCIHGLSLLRDQAFYMTCVQEQEFKKILYDNFSRDNTICRASVEFFGLTFLLALITYSSPQVWFTKMGFVLGTLGAFVFGTDENIDKGNILNWLYYESCKVGELCQGVGKGLIALKNGELSSCWEPYVYAWSVALSGEAY